MTRVAAIDCGTNSLRLLVADVDPGSGALADVDRRTEIVRLGEGVDATGLISDAALDRTLSVARFYAAIAAEAGVTPGVGAVRIVATSATRDAGNADRFGEGMREIFGVAPEVVTGEDEAALAFAGAVRALRGRRDGGPVLVVDIGGGSTEVVLGDDPGAADQVPTVLAARSVDIGSVRLTERHLHSDPPTPAEVERARAEVDEALDVVAEAVPLDKATLLVGVAGTVMTITAHALALPTYDSEAVDGAELPVATVRAACADLLGRTRERRGELPYLQTGRVDVIGAGALIWGEVVERVHRAAGLETVLASEHDILDGIAWSLAHTLTATD
jgi:exopolyphosphatase/guanosine-5'-triphosphate,3'-diphosphate pyrophosphatase